MSEQQPGAPAVPGVTRYRGKRPIVVEAIQWTGGNLDAIRAFAGEYRLRYLAGAEDETLCVWSSRHSDWQPVLRGRMVVRGPLGMLSEDFFPLPADLFASFYEPAGEASQVDAAGSVSDDAGHARPTAPEASRDRSGATSAEPIERDRAERAEAKLAAVTAELKAVMAGFFTHYGNNTAASLLLARDLAEGIRQILDRDKGGAGEEVGHGR